MNKLRTLVAVCACMFSLGIPSISHSAVIDAYFGMNFVDATTLFGAEVQLLDITYTGGGSSVFTTAIPACAGLTPLGLACLGLPDGRGLSVPSTYLTGGDGETTRTYGAKVPIDWDLTSFAFPSIAITGFTLDVAGTWGLSFATPYVVGLIPAGGPDMELVSLLAAPQGDIYDGLLGAIGNPVGTALISSTPAGGESLLGTSADFTFAAAAVPLPPALWLFVSGLLGCVGISRRKLLNTCGIRRA